MEPDEQKEEEIVRRLLQSLPRKEPPWYFEARLIQRLNPTGPQEEPRARNVFSPVYLTSVLVLVLVGFFSYYLASHDDGSGPDSAIPPTRSGVQAQDSLAPEEKPSLAVPEPQSDINEKLTIPTGPRRPSGASMSRVLEKDSHSKKPEIPTIIMRAESVSLRAGVPDTTDSLKVPPDSL